MQNKGVSYGDLRLSSSQIESITVKNSELRELQMVQDSGMNLRVFVDGSWGFASIEKIDLKKALKAVDQAIDRAKAFSGKNHSGLELVFEPVHIDEWHTPYIIHPFSVPLEEKLGLLFKVNSLLRSHSMIGVASANMRFKEEKKVFANTEGSFIRQTLLSSGGGMQAIAIGHGDVQVRSYPMSFRGQFKSGGYEVILGLEMEKHCIPLRKEAVALLTAPLCPRKKTDIILGKGQMVLQIHESVGHANELDRVLGWEADFAGRSFNKIEHLGKFQYGSPIVNLLADTTAPSGLATFGYDDEGVMAQRFYVVKDGIFQNYFTTRDTAAFIGANRSNGCSRAQNWRFCPITRIPNLSLLPGKESLEEIISSTDEGIFMDYNKSWSIDQWRLNFQFGCEIGWIIKGGKIRGMVKNPTYQSITPEFWNSCTAIGDHQSWDLIGVINCGKGQPIQVAQMSHGCSPARFQNIQVGV
ncbi:MAG: TldD/PmbA family protein [Planctomycetota bacterium]|nr:MAG: TldD/PmbA family protein [Planctomycetota bacterium]